MMTGAGKPAVIAAEQDKSSHAVLLRCVAGKAHLDFPGQVSFSKPQRLLPLACLPVHSQCTHWSLGFEVQALSERELLRCSGCRSLCDAACEKHCQTEARTCRV
jgi:hypothetical protein